MLKTKSTAAAAVPMLKTKSTAPAAAAASAPAEVSAARLQEILHTVFKPTRFMVCKVPDMDGAEIRVAMLDRTEAEYTTTEEEDQVYGASNEAAFVWQIDVSFLAAIDSRAMQGLTHHASSKKTRRKIYATDSRRTPIIVVPLTSICKWLATKKTRENKSRLEAIIGALKVRDNYHPVDVVHVCKRGLTLKELNDGRAPTAAAVSADAEGVSTRKRAGAGAAAAAAPEHPAPAAAKRARGTRGSLDVTEDTDGVTSRYAREVLSAVGDLLRAIAARPTAE
jgi:hypothetical protein